MEEQRGGQQRDPLRLGGRRISRLREQWGLNPALSVFLGSSKGRLVLLPGTWAALSLLRILSPQAWSVNHRTPRTKGTMEAKVDGPWQYPSELFGRTPSKPTAM